MESGKSNIQFGPVPFEEAAKIIRDRQVVSREVFDQLAQDLRARAFLISGVEDLNVVQQIRDLIAEIPRGGSWEGAKEQIIEKLGPWMDEESARRRAVLLMRHHGFQAYAAAKYRDLVEQSDTFPYWQYLTMGDELVRDSHAALHGLILPWNDPFWLDHFPPWDWGCRCMVVPLMQIDYDEAVADNRVAGIMNPTMEMKRRGWVLGQEGMKALHDRQILDDGSGMPVSVVSPAEKALRESGPAAAKAAYQWNPGDLQIPIEQLAPRYEQKTMEFFERTAKSTPIAPPAPAVPPPDDASPGLPGLVLGGTGAAISLWSWLTTLRKRAEQRRSARRKKDLKERAGQA